MFQRTLAGALLIAAGTAAALAYKLLSDKRKETAEEDDDDEIRFISITDEEEEEDISDEAKELCVVYPYLDPAFADHMLKENADLNGRYPEDTLVTITHTVSFPDEESAEAFADIMEPNGYEIRKDGNDLLAVRRFFTQDGAIVSDVLNVANQAEALKGTYRNYLAES